MPSLLAVGLRPPYMHAGCAPTLREALGPCGGDVHDVAGDVGEEATADLLAFLESL